MGSFAISDISLFLRTYTDRLDNWLQSLHLVKDLSHICSEDPASYWDLQQDGMPHSTVLCKQAPLYVPVSPRVLTLQPEVKRSIEVSLMGQHEQRRKNSRESCTVVSLHTFMRMHHRPWTLEKQVLLKADVCWMQC